MWEAALPGSSSQTSGVGSSTPRRDGKIPGGREMLVLQNHSSSILQTKAVGTPLEDTSRSLQADLSRRQSSPRFPFISQLPTTASSISPLLPNLCSCICALGLNQLTLSSQPPMRTTDYQRKQLLLKNYLQKPKRLCTHFQPSQPFWISHCFTCGRHTNCLLVPQSPSPSPPCVALGIQ